MEETQQGKYLQLMQVVRSRFDTIKALSTVDNFSKAELAAFHGRKIIEAIAFGCLIGTKNGFKTIPKDAEGQYNAEKILKTLGRKGIEIFPSPSIIRDATDEEIKKYNVKGAIDGLPDRRITRDEIIKKYQRMHNWLHELNPYTKEGQEEFYNKNNKQLIKDIEDLELFLSSHTMSINGEMFFCTLNDKIDGTIKVVSLSKRADL